MNSTLRTAAALVRDIAEEEAADAYDALFSEILELRKEVNALRREVGVLKRGMLGELERLQEGLIE